MELSLDFIKKMLRSIASTQDQELGCDECFDELDCFVEMELAGKNAAEALPLVEDHLHRCGACYEEYQALLDALQAISEDEELT